MKTKSLYIDCPRWNDPVKPDDFLVAIGKNKSNSVYHVVESRKGREKNRMIRYYLKVINVELIIALSREEDQALIPVYWYTRNKNSNAK